MHYFDYADYTDYTDYDGNTNSTDKLGRDINIIDIAETRIF